MVKVRLGEEYPHPDDHDHFIGLMQLWNRETLLAEARYSAGVNGHKPTHFEVDFFISCTRRLHEPERHGRLHQTRSLAE